MTSAARRRIDAEIDAKIAKSRDLSRLNEWIEMHPMQRRLGRIAAGFNAKARRLNRRGVVLWTHLFILPSECKYCGIGLDTMEGSYDHAIPWDRGGTNDPSNIVRCCLDCQRRKFNKTPEEFAEHREMWVTCELPGCDNTFVPRYAEAKRGMARYCSRSHAAKSRWV